MVTMNDIAEKAGVSQTTVSFVLSGRENGIKLKEETRQRVLDVAHALGYRRNELARAMVTGKSRILGVLTYDNNGEHIATIIAGALREAVKDGYAVKVLHVPFNGSPDEISDIAYRCTAWQLDGVIAVSLAPDVLAVLAKEFQNSGCPIAYVETASATRDEIVVRTDDRSAFRAAIEHLTALGHRRIAHLCGPSEHPLTQRRNAIFLEVLREFQLSVEPDSVIPTHPSEWMNRESIERAAHSLLDRAEPPTAVICAGDATAMILMRVARQRCVPVPEKLSVIGFGNFGLGAHADPPLSTIAQPFRDMGRLAVQRLIETISADDSTAAASRSHGADELPTHLVVRESTAPLAD